MSTAGLTSTAPTRSWDYRSRAYRIAFSKIVAGPVSLLLLAMMIWKVLHGPAPAFDFRFAYTAAGHRVLAGASPYTWTPEQFRIGLAFVYPALSALMFAPLALLPQAPADVLFTFVCVALVPATLWLLRVRDWRTYGIALVWMPVYGAWMTVNESLFMMFGLACAWHWRDRPWAAGLLTATMISLKPLLWPLALWLLVTRRWRASGWALASGLLLNLAAWSAIGFDQIGRYLHAAAIDTADSWRTGYGIPALLGHFGLGRGVGLAAVLIVSALLVAAVIYSGFVKHDQVQALTLAVALALLSSPLIWGHYLVLLIVPMALLRPRLDWVWVLPLLMWVCQPAAPVHTWQELVNWSAAAAMFVALTRRRSGTVRAQAAS